MATDQLTGNMATEHLLDFLAEQGQDSGLNLEAFAQARAAAAGVFAFH
jgi:hydroxymethylglutaryl-CoA lyase